MALQLRSQLCTFENSTNCNEISFDPHSFSEELKGLLRIILITVKKCLVSRRGFKDGNFEIW